MITGTYVQAIMTLEAALLPTLTTPVTIGHLSYNLLMHTQSLVLPLQHGTPTKRET